MSALGELRVAVLRRDRQCVAYLLDRLHTQCRDQWGQPHAPTDIDKLTLEHVKQDGKRIDKPLHCIALCHGANVLDHWSSANNEIANAFLMGIAVGQGVR